MGTQFNPVALMKSKHAVEVAAVSMMTGVGDTANKTAAAVRAGIDSYHETAFQDQNLEQITASFLPDEALSPVVPDVLAMSRVTGKKQRLLRLLTKPLLEIKEKLDMSQPVILLVVVSEGLPNEANTIGKDFIHMISMQCEIEVDYELSATLALGRAGGLIALNHGMNLMEQNKANQILVIGVDSYMDFMLLDYLGKEKRLLATDIGDGFVPGEAAGCVLIQKFDSLSAATITTENISNVVQIDRKILLWPPGYSAEPGHRFEPSIPYKGEGLSAAIELALDSNSEKAVQNVFCSLNGESFGSKEWGVSALRNKNLLAQGMKMHHPAEYIGDVGAATGPILIGLATIGMKQGYHRGDSLVWSSSELSARSAARLSLA